MASVKYPFLVLHRRKWIVRMIVPPDVRAVIGQTVFRISTGEGDPHVAHSRAAPIIAALQKRIRDARANGITVITSKTAEFTARYRALPNGSDTAAKLLMGEILAHTGELERRTRNSLHQRWR
jgi:hypothetical protein